MAGAGHGPTERCATMSSRGQRLGPTPRWDARVALVFGATLSFAQLGTPHAHALDIGYLRIDGRTIVLDVDVTIAATLLGITTTSVTAELLRARGGELATKTYGRTPPISVGGACTLGPPTSQLIGPTARLTATIDCPDVRSARRWELAFVGDPALPASFELLVKDVGTDQLTVVDHQTMVVTLGAAAVVAPATPAATPAHRSFASSIVVGVVVLVLTALGLVVYRRRRRA
jgi:hypothetical protein